MRMKEISEKTGLTDRAVRLYIDSGLLSPNEESSYTGRRSLDFSDADIEVLLAIATLRRADFTIADIRRMQTEPENIGEIIAAHKEKLQSDIETKKRILQNLECIDADVNPQREKKLLFTDVAELIEKSASENQIPGEDSSMRDIDFKRMMKRRIPSIAAALILLLTIWALITIFVKTAFAEIYNLPGGEYGTDYYFTAERFFEHILLFVSLLALIGAFFTILAHILSGNKRVLIISIALLIIFIIGVAVQTESVQYDIFKYEFYFLRFTFFNNGHFATNREFQIRAAKYVLAAVSAILCAISYFLSEKE